MVHASPGRWMALAVAVLALSGCGATSTDTLAPASTVAPTDYRTLPPPTTTTPPTTTAPLQAGDVIAGESTYVVAEGDYPFVVADRFQVDFDAFVALNGWTVENGAVPEWPTVGTTIRIPPGAVVPDDPDQASRLTPSPTTSTLVPPDGSAVETSAAPDVATTVGSECDTYTVASGDYPTRVAQRLGVTVDELDAANRNTKGYDVFYVGLEINVPC
jgi:LysM repeat protein